MSRCLCLLAASLLLASGVSRAETGGGLDRAVRIVPRQPPVEPAEPAPTLPPAPKFQNAVDVKLEILPGSTVPIGSTMSFRVSGPKPGYVLIVDVDAIGKLTQIFPNAMSLGNGDKAGAESNRLAAGATLLIPIPGSKTYQFVAGPPRGIGMVVAIFSEAPLDVIDLPDIPAQLVGSSEAAGFVHDAASSLRIVSEDGKNGFQEPKLSMDAVFYAIR